MALEKQKITDKIECVRIHDHYVLQVRERNQILEDGQEISSSFHRYVLNPDADVSAISDDVVKAQFNAVMTQTVKDNYTKFLKEQKEQIKSS